MFLHAYTCIGSTSSGKSTLSNVLLGEFILPTDYNAATSVLCIIKYGKKKEATIRYQEQEEETVDLTTTKGRQKLATALGRKHTKLNIGQQQIPSCSSDKLGTSSRDRNDQCSQVTISWPSDFLKVKVCSGNL